MALIFADIWLSLSLSLSPSLSLSLSLWQLALAHALAAAPALRTVYVDEGDDPLWRGYDEDDDHRRPVGHYGLGTDS